MYNVNLHSDFLLTVEVTRRITQNATGAVFHLDVERDRTRDCNGTFEGDTFIHERSTLDGSSIFTVTRLY